MRKEGDQRMNKMTDERRKGGWEKKEQSTRQDEKDDL